MKITIDETGVDKRLDAFLGEHEELKLSRSYIKKLIEQGQITIDDKEKKASYKLSLDDEIDIVIPDSEELNLAAENIPLDIIYEDDDLMVINKPINMIVHPAPGIYSGTLVNAVLYHAQQATKLAEGTSQPGLSDINGVLRPGIVHRLDKDTSGLIVVAKNNDAHQSLAKQIQDRTCKRFYKAIAQGKFKESKGEINKPIGRDPKERKRMAVAISSRAKSRSALTRFKVLEALEFGSKHYSLIECELETGRTHQIRVHMSWYNHPIIGDYIYNASKKTGFNVRRPMLHAYRLSFEHPRTQEKMFFEAPLADDFEAILGILGHVKK
ncbi:MAG: RluA family pseudouridine synthase [Candidatus Melainabacteria bacterium]|jgi:23S rRNA pseudouridine1911/1915/1917 synthase|nr:RluA family pseudouridine synthase [Candidatus Melainabacteria bacterium]